MKRIMKNTNNDIYYHLVWCTKFMRPVLEGDVVSRLTELLHEKANEMEGNILWQEVRPTTVQIKCSFPPQLSPHQIVVGFKYHSAHFLRTEFPWLNSRLSNLWTRSYFIGTLGEVRNERIEQFLLEQEFTNRPKRGKVI